MPTQKQDIAFLRKYLRQCRRWLEMSHYLSLPDADLGVQTKRQLREYEAEEERAARIAEANGFDATPFRAYLTPDENPLSHREIKMLRERIHIAAQCLAKMEAAENDKNSIIPLTDNEVTVLTDFAKNEGRSRHRVVISMATEVSEGTLKSILPLFEKRGWINRPKGPRSGYAITDAGMELSNKYSPKQKQ